MSKQKFSFAVLVLVFCILMSGYLAMAKEERKAEDTAKAGVMTQAAQKKLTPEESQAELEKQVLMNNIRDLQAQAAKVGVLGDLYNQELIQLRQKQAFFCDLYKLDIEKFRKGMYQLDEKTGKIVEKPAEQAKQIGV